MAADIQGQRHDRTALVLYGSETGNSQDVAEELGRLTERLHFMTRVDEMDFIELNQLSQYDVVIFSVSTTGQGEFPKNARKFWKSLLRKRLPPGCLSHVKFTTFGLGDSSYPKFNFSSRKLHKRLVQLGAKEIYSRGEADDQHSEGIDGTFLSWSVDFGKHLLTAFPLPEGISPIPSDQLLPPKYTLELLEETISIRSVPSFARNNNQQQKMAGTIDHSIRLDTSELVRPQVCEQLKEAHDEPTSIDLSSPASHMLDVKDGIDADVVHNVRLTPEDHWQDVREIELLIDEQWEFVAGDYLTIYPKNFDEDVHTLIVLQGWEIIADKPLKFKAEAPDFYLDKRFVSLPAGRDLVPLEKSTLRELLTHNLDITAIPKRFFFQLIANHSTDPTHKARLHEFADATFIDEYYDYATRPRRSMLEVLQDFPSVKLPWQWACSLFPTIRGRHYSISSGGKLKGDLINGKYRVQILVAIVKYRTVLKKVRQGLCSRYLASLSKNTRIRITVNKTNEFNKLVRDRPSVPILCIAPGTGVAPIRSLIWERAIIQGEEVAPAYLFYGGRNRCADFLYEDDWDRHELQTRVFTAFSRDQKEKIYVQDVLKREKELVADLVLKKHAIVFVCGSSGSMPKAVRQTLFDIVREKVNWPENELVEWFGHLDKDGRYVQETW